MSPGSASATALDRFLEGLAARDTSLHTQRAYRTAVAGYLAWLSDRGVDWRSPARTDLRAYLGHLADAGARTTVAQRLAAIRAFYRFALRAGLARGNPWAAMATPRLPAPLPKVLEVEQIVVAFREAGLLAGAGPGR